VGIAYWNKLDLTWRKPEWPLATEMFDKDGHETFDGTEDSTVDHYGTLRKRL
jgi:hypothetical protein